LSHTFTAQAFGYGSQSGQALTVTIENIGEEATGALTLTLSDTASFQISTTTISSIAANNDDTFTIEPKTGLDASQTAYTATVIVSGGNIGGQTDAELTLTVSFTVNKVDRTSGPGITVTGVSASMGIIYTLTASNPAESTYDVYYKAGNNTLPADTSDTSLISTNGWSKVSAGVSAGSGKTTGGAFPDENTYTLAAAARGNANYNDSVSTRAVVGYTSINLANSSPDGTGLGWTYSGNVYTVQNGAVVRVYGDNDGQKRLAVAESARAVITLDGVTIDGLDWGQTPLELKNQANLTLSLAGESSLSGGGHGAGIYVPQNRTLNIEGPGDLNAQSRGYAAGIGGNSDQNSPGMNENNSGTIIINGGSITANSGDMAPGIGGGVDGRANNVTINGGAVIAINNGNTNYNGPGIGGWQSASVIIRGDALVFARATGGWEDVNGLTQTGGVLVGKNRGVNVFHPAVITLYQNTTVPADFTFTIPVGKILNLNGYTLTNTGAVVNNGTINKQGGTISNQGGVTGGGTIN
jgi:hypothetical protein